MTVMRGHASPPVTATVLGSTAEDRPQSQAQLSMSATQRGRSPAPYDLLVPAHPPRAAAIDACSRASDSGPSLRLGSGGLSLRIYLLVKVIFFMTVTVTVYLCTVVCPQPSSGSSPLKQWLRLGVGRRQARWQAAPEPSRLRLAGDAAHSTANRDRGRRSPTFRMSLSL